MSRRSSAHGNAYAAGTGTSVQNFPASVRSFADVAVASTGTASTISAAKTPPPASHTKTMSRIMPTTTIQMQQLPVANPPTSSHQHPRRSSAASQNKKQSIEVTTAQFAQVKLLEATHPEHRAAVDDTLGAYITTQLLQQQYQIHHGHIIDDDHPWDALVELIHDHCHVEWSNARSVLEAIVEQINASTVIAEGSLLPNGLFMLDEDGAKERTDGHAATPDALFLSSGPAATQETSTINPSKRNGKALPERSSISDGRSTDEDQVTAPPIPATTRSRQTSIDESSRKSSIIDETPPVIPVPPPHTLPPSYYYSPPISMQYDHPDLYFYHQQQQDYVYTTTELLLSMNAELSHEAAYMASLIANADVNLAQYLVECTVADVPICRDFLMHNACYRSDCPFSHVRPETHTCVFWFKSTCGKGATCRFLHNFSDRLIQSLPQLSSNIGSSNPALPLHPAATANPELLRFPDESSFATIAQQNFVPQAKQFVEKQPTPKPVKPPSKIRSIPIPPEVWNVSENRDATVFGIENPLERYAAVQRKNPRDTVMDLHFQSLKTFPIVLETLLDGLLEQHGAIWIVTGTGHHVGHRTHQKSGGALEAAVMAYLTEHGYSFKRGKDKTGQSGALFVDGYSNVE